MFVYPCSIKICASGFDEILESIFCRLKVVEAFSLQKVVEMLEDVVVGWREVRWSWWKRQNFAAQFIQLLEQLCDVHSGEAVENGAHSVDQHWLQALPFSVHPIDLLSILLRYNGFTRLQRAVVDQTSSRPPNSDHDLLWCKFGLGKCMEFVLGPTTELVIDSCHIKSTFHHALQSNQEMLHRIREPAAAKSHQSCPTLCDPIDGSPPGSPVSGILQARTLEWVAISFSNAWKWKVKVKSLSRVRLLATPWTAAYQSSPSMGFSRQEYWSG